MNLSYIYDNIYHWKDQDFPQGGSRGQESSPVSKRVQIQGITETDRNGRTMSGGPVSQQVAPMVPLSGL